MKGKYAKIVSVDFDGVLHSYTSGWQGADVIPDPPVPGAIEWLMELAEDPRFLVSIFSARNARPGGIPAMQLWFLDQGLSPAVLEGIKFPVHKPAAFVTIDDRAIQFDGRFPRLHDLDSFRPWYKR